MQPTSRGLSVRPPRPERNEGSLGLRLRRVIAPTAHGDRGIRWPGVRRRRGARDPTDPGRGASYPKRRGMTLGNFGVVEVLFRPDTRLRPGDSTPCSWCTGPPSRPGLSPNASTSTRRGRRRGFCSTVSLGSAGSPGNDTRGRRDPRGSGTSACDRTATTQRSAPSVNGRSGSRGCDSTQGSPRPLPMKPLSEPAGRPPGHQFAKHASGGESLRHRSQTEPV